MSTLFREEQGSRSILQFAGESKDPEESLLRVLLICSFKEKALVSRQFSEEVMFFLWYFEVQGAWEGKKPEFLLYLATVERQGEVILALAQA